MFLAYIYIYTLDQCPQRQKKGIQFLVDGIAERGEKLWGTRYSARVLKH